MEITHLLPTISLTSFPFSNRFEINPLRRTTHPKFPPPPPPLQRTPFSISYSFRTDPNLQISRQRSKRRNSLRKKLEQEKCIELYTSDESGERVGFYSLEMAADLEIEPKPHHVITFEDPQDSKNFCYIIQAHMEMLGNGNAFVVPRPPKDAYREAQANGFGVTVIRKRELALNVDQTLEEVEEQISEIGSKVYHDAIMRERGVDIRTLMKGVFGSRKRAERRRRRRSKGGGEAEKATKELKEIIEGRFSLSYPAKHVLRKENQARQRNVKVESQVPR